MDNKRLAKCFKKARKEILRLDQIKFAKIAGLTQSGISLREKGLVEIGHSEIKKVAKAAKLPLSFFYGDEYSSIQTEFGETAIPIYTTVPANPEFPRKKVPSLMRGCSKNPDHLFPGADFILKNPTNLAEIPDDKGDIYFFKIENKPVYGKPMLLEYQGKFYIARITFNNDQVEIHRALAGKESIKAKQENICFMGQLLYVAYNIYWGR